MLRNSHRLLLSTLCLMLLHLHYTNGDMKVICDQLDAGVYPTEKCTHFMTKRLNLWNNNITIDEQFSKFKDDTNSSKYKILPFDNYQSAKVAEVYEKLSAFAKEQGFQGIMVSLPHRDLEEAYKNIMEPILQHDLELYVSIGIYYRGLDRHFEPDVRRLVKILRNKEKVNMVVEIIPDMEQFNDLMKNTSEIYTQRSYWEKRINFLTKQGIPTSNIISMVAPYVFEYTTRPPISCAYKRDLNEFCQFNLENKKLTSTNEVREIRCEVDACFLKESSLLHKEKITLLTDAKIGGFYFTRFPSNSSGLELDHQEQELCFKELNDYIRLYIDAIPQSG